MEKPPSSSQAEVCHPTVRPLKTRRLSVGCSLLRAREIYTKVIRSALLYGAGVWHYPTEQRQKGIAKQLATNQSQCLRVVSGAYRATPVRFLEVETVTLPLDLYLNRRVADFERRLEHSGKGDLIRSVCV